MSLFLVFTGSFITAFSGAVTPGPLLFYTIAQSTKNGGFTGFFVIIGHMILELIIVLILLLGLQNLINKLVLEIILLLLGGLLLITMGVTTFLPVIKKDFKNGISIKNDEIKKSRLSLITGGFIMSISNPYFLLWWLVIGAGYLFASLKLGFTGVVAFFIGHISADMLWYVFISQCVNKSKKILTGKFYTGIIIACSFLIIIIGLIFMVKGITLL